MERGGWAQSGLLPGLRLAGPICVLFGQGCNLQGEMRKQWWWLCCTPFFLANGTGHNIHEGHREEKDESTTTATPTTTVSQPQPQPHPQPQLHPAIAVAIATIAISTAIVIVIVTHCRHCRIYI